MHSVESFINHLWYGPRRPYHWLLIISLLPLSFLFLCIVKIRRYAYDSGLSKVSDLPVPIVVIGNISVGGTGKTPLAIFLALALRQAGLNVGIVSRGYGTTEKSKNYPLIVTVGEDPAVCGDEPLMIKRNTGVHVVVDPVRSRGGTLLANRLNCDVVLCDDGLQHYALGRQLEIGVIDASRKFGNKLPLPAGPLREPVSRIGKCQYVIINSGVVLSCPEGQFDIKGVDNKNIYTMVLQSSVLVNIRTGEIKNISQFSGAIVHAVAGIGNPDRFFSSLRQLGLQVIEHPRPDHHVLQEQELDFGDSHLIIMTEKDAVKLCQPVATNLWYLPVTAHLPDSFVKKFLADVKSFIK